MAWEETSITCSNLKQSLYYLLVNLPVVGNKKVCFLKSFVEEKHLFLFNYHDQTGL